MEIVIGITGASGVTYGIRLLRELSKLSDMKVHLVVSENAKKILEFETKNSLNEIMNLSNQYYQNNDLTGAIASGSKVIAGMVIVPCTMSTAAKINTGIADNLITRTADVCLKEHRKLIIVPRETPLNSTHLKNLYKLSMKGVIVIPAMPGFYHKPENIEELLDFITGKILDNLNLPHNLFKRWSGID